jgi:nitric oxide reductase subunit B
MVWKGRREHPNKAALLWSLGCAVTSFCGAGVLGFMHTLSFINYYTHGTQFTAAHGHLSFYGAYAMVNIAMITFALPILLKREPYNQGFNISSFWLMTLGVFTMSAALAIAGILQSHLQYVVGQEYTEVQQQLKLFYEIRLIGGVMTALGLVVHLIALAHLPRRPPVRVVAVAPAE